MIKECHWIIVFTITVLAVNTLLFIVLLKKIEKKESMNKNFLKIISYAEKIPVNLNRISDDYFGRASQENN